MATVKQKGVTDSGINWAANIARLAAVAVATTNTAAAIQMASLQEEIASGYLSISKEQNDLYFNLYAPCELTEITEACNAETCTPEFDLHIGRMLASVRLQGADRPQKDMQCVSRYCTGKQAAIIKDALVAQAGALAAVANMGHRYALEYCDAQDDLRWARRTQALNRGRDMVSQAVSFSGFALGLFGRLGAQAARGAAGAIGYLAYSGARNPTVYPGRARPERIPKIVPDVEVFPVPASDIQIEDIPVRQPVIRG